MTEERSRSLGIRIIPLDPQYPENFTLVIGNYQSGELFVTSPAIVNAIHESGVKVGRNIGLMEVIINGERRMLTTRQVDPTKYLPTYHGAIHRMPHDIQYFRRIGMATLVEARIEKYLKKKFPGWQIISTSDPKWERERQLRERGRKRKVPIGIENAYELTKKKVIEQFTRHKSRIMGLNQRLKTRRP